MARLHEEASGERQREVYACKVKLQDEKKAAVVRLEAKIADQVSRHQAQLQKMREQYSREVATVKGELEGQLTDEKERTNQLRESLASCRKVG